MAIRAEIKCINKTPRNDPHDRIHSVGGVNPDGGRWKLAQPAAVAGVDSGTYSFYVSQAGYIVDVIVAVSQFGHRYLKTVPDGVQPDNLLKLPECPP
jgi:hypothetical protein